MTAYRSAKHFLSEQARKRERGQEQRQPRAATERNGLQSLSEQFLELDLEANAGECDSDKEFITVGKQRFKQRLIEIGICNVAAQNRVDCDHGNKGQNELG